MGELTNPIRPLFHLLYFFLCFWHNSRNYYQRQQQQKRVEMDVTDCRGSPLYPFPLLVGERTNQANLSEILDNDATPHTAAADVAALTTKVGRLKKMIMNPPFFSLSPSPRLQPLCFASLINKYQIYRRRERCLRCIIYWERALAGVL